MSYNFRTAGVEDIPAILEVLNHAIERRKNEGSNQWQDGYPNFETVNHDILQNEGYVLMDENIICGYCAVLINDEPEYENIEGEWLSKEDFVVFHRVAISETYLGKGLAKLMITHIEMLAERKNILSVKADTNFDNKPMINIFQKMGYTYCGEVYFRGSPRKAFEKILG